MLCVCPLGQSQLIGHNPAGEPKWAPWGHPPHRREGAARLGGAGEAGGRDGRGSGRNDPQRSRTRARAPGTPRPWIELLTSPSNPAADARGPRAALAAPSPRAPPPRAGPRPAIGRLDPGPSPIGARRRATGFKEGAGARCPAAPLSPRRARSVPAVRSRPCARRAFGAALAAPRVPTPPPAPGSGPSSASGSGARGRQDRGRRRPARRPGTAGEPRGSRTPGRRPWWPRACR